MFKFYKIKNLNFCYFKSSTVREHLISIGYKNQEIFRLDLIKIGNLIKEIKSFHLMPRYWINYSRDCDGYSDPYCFMTLNYWETKKTFNNFKKYSEGRIEIYRISPERAKGQSESCFDRFLYGN